MKNETKIGNFILILLESGTLEDLKKLRENNSHLDHKQRSDTLLSVKERNIIQKITEAKEKIKRCKEEINMGFNRLYFFHNS